MPRSKARLRASSALSSSLYMRKRLPPPMARMETCAPVRPRARLGKEPVLPISVPAARLAAKGARAVVPRKLRREIRMCRSFRVRLSQSVSDRNQGLGESTQSLADQGCPWEQSAEIGGVEQVDVAQIVLDVKLPAIGGRALDQRPHAEFSRDAALPSGGEKVEEGRQQVRLDWKRAVGCLYPIGFADAGDLVGELGLALVVAYVFDY